MRQRETAKQSGGWHSHRQPDRPPCSANSQPLSATPSRAWSRIVSPPTVSGKTGGCHPHSAGKVSSKFTFARLHLSISPGRSGGLAVCPSFLFSPIIISSVISFFPSILSLLASLSLLLSFSHSRLSASCCQTPPCVWDSFPLPLCLQVPYLTRRGISVARLTNFA